MRVTIHHEYRGDQSQVVQGLDLWADLLIRTVLQPPKEDCPPQKRKSERFCLSDAAKRKKDRQHA